MTSICLPYADARAALVEAIKDHLAGAGLDLVSIVEAPDPDLGSQLFLSDDEGPVIEESWCSSRCEWTTRAFIQSYVRGTPEPDARLRCQLIAGCVVGAVWSLPQTSELAIKVASIQPPVVIPDPDEEGWIVQAIVELACHGEIPHSTP